VHALYYNFVNIIIVDRTFSNDNENLDLVEAVRKHPCSIFYFDKIEKTHITGEVPRRLLKLLDLLGSNEERKDMRSYTSQQWLPGWLPSLRDPSRNCYPSFLSSLRFV